jgi:aspartyl-tRNA(Asn)/glutamyl-tRNA(Gln) amidotransferase subunit C
MAKITQSDVEHVATLARLELTEAEKTKFTEQLGAVLEYFEKLDAVKTSEVRAIDQINEMRNVTTGDVVGEKYEREELLKNAPEQEDGFIKVKKVFE